MAFRRVSDTKVKNVAAISAPRTLGNILIANSPPCRGDQSSAQ
jgi:hypothetical protein